MRNHLGNREPPLRLRREVGVVHVRSLALQGTFCCLFYMMPLCALS